MNELLLIGKSVGTALLATSVWLVPLLIYRKVKGIPLIPAASFEPIDLRSRKERNKLMFSVIASAVMGVCFFAGGGPITGVLFLLVGLYLLIYFHTIDRKIQTEDIKGK